MVKVVHEANQRKLSFKKSQDAAKLLAEGDKNNLGSANPEEHRRRSMFQETAFLYAGRISSSDLNSMYNNDKIKNDRHYSLNIIDDQNFNVGRTGGTTLTPLMLNSENDDHQRKINNGKISDGTAPIVLSPMTMPTPRLVEKFATISLLSGALAKKNLLRVIVYDLVFM
uniref:Uncharacterized protein n=1 Tax=Romanomermis culicivorax TaxID=13658 RepID=A0A915L4H6_ROMCU